MDKQEWQELNGDDWDENRTYERRPYERWNNVINKWRPWNCSEEEEQGHRYAEAMIRVLQEQMIFSR